MNQKLLVTVLLFILFGLLWGVAFQVMLDDFEDRNDRIVGMNIDTEEQTSANFTLHATKHYDLITYRYRAEGAGTVILTDLHTRDNITIEIAFHAREDVYYVIPPHVSRHHTTSLTYLFGTTARIRNGQQSDYGITTPNNISTNLAGYDFKGSRDFQKRLRFATNRTFTMTYLPKEFDSIDQSIW